MKLTFNTMFIGTILLSAIIYSCNKSKNNTAVQNTVVPIVYSKIYGATSIKSDGEYITIKTNGLPDHKSVYYPATNSLHEAYNGTTFGGNTFVKNPNVIIPQNFTFIIPVKPGAAANHTATPLGPIGVAVNGVPLYNQYAGPGNQPLTIEVASFDKYYGHPQQTGQYHYHVEPLYLTTVKSTKYGLMGFLLDGFPVYGPQEENGSTITSYSLDAYHGHSHATIDYPNGVYHYHFTNDAPYLNGNGFYGTPGTVTQ
jgi:YHYH protein